MTQVREDELSALLDGELEPRRAEQVRAAIEADPALRREFEALARLDAGLRDMAGEAGFVPELTFAATASGTSAWRWPAGLAVVLALIGARLLPKLAELPLFGVALQLAGCAAIAFVVVAMARETAPLAAQVYGKGTRA